jgi:hypothetical protein
MKSFIRTMALLGLFALGAGTASAGVTVKYIEPDKFADLPFAPWEREEVLHALTEYFTELGQNLPPGQDLAIEVTDVDLAGREFPETRGPRDLRIMKGMADWPIINLRYTLTANGQVVKSGEAKIADMNYMQRINPFSDGERLRYERRMLEEWFFKNIAPKKKG